jgi:hypothetical protein
MVGDWVIFPFIGVGPLTFDITRGQARAVLQSTAVGFRKGLETASEADAFDELGIHLHYDGDERLECVELWGARTVLLNGVSLLNLPIVEVLANLDAAHLSYHYDDGYFIDSCGCALYAHDNVVKAVTVYRKGYC